MWLVPTMATSPPYEKAEIMKEDNQILLMKYVIGFIFLLVCCYPFLMKICYGTYNGPSGGSSDNFGNVLPIIYWKAFP
jgi:hypothetical protein